MYRDNCRSDRRGPALLWEHRRRTDGLRLDRRYLLSPWWWKYRQMVSKVERREIASIHSAQHVGPRVVRFCSGLFLNVSDTMCGCGFWSNLKDKLPSHIYGSEVRAVDQMVLIWNSNLWDCLHCSHSIQHPHSMTYQDKRCCNCYQDKNLNSPPAVSLHSGSLMQFKHSLWKGLLKVPLCWIK